MSLPPTACEVRTLVRSAVPALAAHVEQVVLPDGVQVTTAVAQRSLAARLSSGAPAAVVAIGAFDGVHVGHRALIMAAAHDAAARDLPCVAVTFDPDPADILVGVRPGSRIVAPADRARLLIAAGADAVLTLPFTESLARCAYKDFLDVQLAAHLSIVALHVGADFRVGRDGAGTVEMLRTHGEACGFTVHGHPLVVRDGGVVSATRIRGLLAAGNLDGATALLARHHSIAGIVEHGRGEGTAFGFPTANIRADGAVCMPGAGVYATYVVVGDGTGPVMAYAAAANVGAPPTFTHAADPAFLEANLIGFTGELYGCEVVVVFCHRIRAARRFSSVAELERVVLANIAWTRERLGTHGVVVCPAEGVDDD